MKKLSLIIVLSLFVSMVVYGEDLWERGYGNQVIKPISGVDLVGIGTGQPLSKLDVRGTITMSGFKLTTGAHSGYVLTSNSSGIGIWQPAGGGTSYWEDNTNGIHYEGGNVGIGTDAPISKFHVQCNASAPTAPEYQWAAIYGYNTATSYGPIGVYGRVNASNGSAIYGYNKNTDGYAGYFYGKGFFSENVGIGILDPGEKLAVNGDLKISGNSYLVGNVGIGTDDPQSKLDVSGTITADEIEVQSDGLPDFVFEDNYKLMSLGKLEKHIKKEKSLPGIPTSDEAATKGVKVGDMQAKLLQKVEELTLYVIEQDKEIAELKERIAELEK